MQDEVWQAALGEIEVTLSRGNFLTWFKNTSLVKAEDGIVVVGVSNVFIKQQLEKKYNDLIASTLRKQGIKVEKLDYKMVPNSESQKLVYPKLLIVQANVHLPN